MNTLLAQAFEPGTVLLTGAGGYLGALIGGALLAHTDAQVVVPLRQPARAAEVVDTLCAEAQACVAAVGIEACKQRIRCIDWPEVAATNRVDLRHRMQHAGVTDVIHCAGCLDYHDEAALQLINVDYTAHLAAAAAALRVDRFAYVSTAYSAGYLDTSTENDATIAERISAEEPQRDPTGYTRSKRHAERVVATTDVPWLILRPSIVIGAARNGRYSGKRYGLYQQWMGLERLLSSKYHAEIHTVAPVQPLNLLHQDVFQDALLASLRYVPPQSVVNLVSRDAVCPSMRTLWELWMEHVSRPQRVVYYKRFDDVDLKAIDMRQRAYLTFAQVNLEIGAHRWRFDRHWLEQLERSGHLQFTDASFDSVKRCQDHFVAASDVLAAYRRKFNTQFPSHVRTVLHGQHDESETPNASTVAA
jgi:nucleoside-diphosphate-sugar epimerase